MASKKGSVLRAYQFYDNGNGNGIVWALPRGAPFPHPNSCVSEVNTLWEEPRPPDALDNFMEVIEGDGSPESYLATSILCRELRELGAMWHGCSWSTHSILYENPIPPDGDRRDNRALSYFAEWKWIAKRPKKWAPRVTVSKNKITVTFYTFSGLGVEQVLRHTDTYHPGTLTFETKDTETARGGSGYIF